MSRTMRILSCAACLCGAMAAGARAAQPLLAPGDALLAIDLDVVSNSNYPGGEPPLRVLDAMPGTKYLNFGRRNTGFIVTPVSGASQVQSIVLTTANDATARDPASWALYGTNDAIVSLDNSNGSGENWTLVDSGVVALPDARLTVAPAISVNNASMYSSYRLIFPTLKDDFGANSMQIADVGFYASNDGSGTNLLAVGDPILAVMLPAPQSRHPAGEAPAMLVDNNPGTKYLNFGKENAGLIMTPSIGETIVTSFQITTANDAPGRDPASWILYGTHDPIASLNNSVGDGEAWTLIDQGLVTLPDARMTAGDIVAVNNSDSYLSYRIVFPTLKDTMAAGVDSLQFSELQLIGEVVPEPSSLALVVVGVAALGFGLRRRSRR